MHISTMHAIVWGVSIVLELLPITTNRYGQDDALSGEFTCYLRYQNNYAYGYFWEIFTFFTPLLMCTFLQIFFSISVFRKFRDMALTPKLNTAVSLLFYYPLAFIIVWLPFIMIFIISSYRLKRQQPVDVQHENIAIAITTTYGFFQSVIFFTRSREARTRWRHLFGFKRDDELSIATDFEEDYKDDISAPLLSSNSLYSSSHRNSSIISIPAAFTTAEIYNNKTDNQMLGGDGDGRAEEGGIKATSDNNPRKSNFGLNSDYTLTNSDIFGLRRSIFDLLPPQNSSSQSISLTFTDVVDK